MARKITDEDIVEALQGRSLPSRAGHDNVVEALQSGANPPERDRDGHVLEALQGSARVRPATKDELPLQSRGDDLEAVSIWAAQEAAQAATSNLAQALMRADPKKGIYAAEAEARKLSGAAYSDAAKTMAYEDLRQKHVQKALNGLAESLTTASKKPTGVAEKMPTALQRRVTTSLRTGLPITHYS